MAVSGLIGIGLVFVAAAVFAVLRGRSSSSLVDSPLSFAKVARSRFGTRSATLVLCCYRTIAAVYIFAVLIANVVDQGADMYFYTLWNWTLLGVYFAMAALAGMACVTTVDGQSVVNPFLVCDEEMPSPADRSHDTGATASERQGADAGSQVKRREGIAARICQILCNLNACNVLVVDVLVWTVLYPSGSDADRTDMLHSFYQWNMHCLNFFLMAIEVVCNDIPPRVSDFVYVMLLAMGYGAFNLARVAVVPATRHCIVEPCHKVGIAPSELLDGYMVWPYFFVDSSRWYAGLFYAGLVLVHWCFFNLSYYARFKLTGREMRLVR